MGHRLVFNLQNLHAIDLGAAAIARQRYEYFAVSKAVPVYRSLPAPRLVC